MANNYASAVSPKFRMKQSSASAGLFWVPLLELAPQSHSSSGQYIWQMQAQRNSIAHRYQGKELLLSSAPSISAEATLLSRTRQQVLATLCTDSLRLVRLRPKRCHRVASHTRVRAHTF